MLSLTDLRKYQIFGVNYILRKRYCALWLGMGLGKTVIALTAIDILLRKEPGLKVLILAPLRTARFTWPEEVRNFQHLQHLRMSVIVGNESERINALNVQADVWVMNHDNVLWLKRHYKNIRKRFPFNMIVVDESSCYKSYEAKRFLTLKSVRPFLKRMVLLSGTPVSDSLLGLWAQIFLLDKGTRLELTFGKYRTKYFEFDLEKDRTGRTYKLKRGNWLEGDEIYEEIIYDKVRDICVSMDTRAYLELPPVSEEVVSIEMDNVLKGYKKFKREAIQVIQEKEVSAINRAALCNKLKQYASGEVYVNKSITAEVHDKKLDALLELLESTNGEPVVIYYWYKHERERLLRALKGYRISELKKDSELEHWNAKKIDILLLHPRSAGHGLNLQKGGHIIIWYSLPFYSAELFNQANKRLDRSGQLLPVLIYILLMRGTVEIDELEVIRGKMTREQAFLRAMKAE